MVGIGIPMNIGLKTSCNDAGKGIKMGIIWLGLSPGGGNVSVSGVFTVDQVFLW